MITDEHWMKIAIEEAKFALRENEVPVGAVIVKNNKIIARAHNQSIMRHDPTAHAEIQALRVAGAEQKNYRFSCSTIFVTLEPCAMCFAALMHARIDRIVFGSYDSKSSLCGPGNNLSNTNFFNHKIEVSGGLLEKQCNKLLNSFFKQRRK